MSPGHPERGTCKVCGNASATPGGQYCDEHRPAPGRPRKQAATAIAAPAAPTSGQQFPGLEDASEAPPAPPEIDEVAPTKPSRRQRWRARLGRRGELTRGGATGERAPRAARPRVTRRRLPLDADVSDIWAFAGRRLEASPHYATGRMLQYQAPAAGVIVDTAIAGTLPDRIIFQPIARNRTKYEDVGFLLAGPLLTFSITTTIGQMQAASDAGDEEAYNELAGRLVMQREMFGWVLSMMLPRLAVGAKLAGEKKAKRDAQIADAFPELGDDDPVQVLMAMLFQPPTFEEANQNGKPDPAPTSDRPEDHVSL